MSGLQEHLGRLLCYKALGLRVQAMGHSVQGFRGRAWDLGLKGFAQGLLNEGTAELHVPPLRIHLR